MIGSASAVQPQVAAGNVHTVGLKSDGTVVAVERNDYGQCNVSSWAGIVQVAAGYLHTQVMCATRRRGVADVISQHVSNNVSESKA